MKIPSLIIAVLTIIATSCSHERQISTAEANAQFEIIQRRSGISFAAEVRLLNHGDGGGRDASYGFYNWTVFSPSQLVLPKMKETYIEKGYLSLPLEDSIRLLKVTAKGEDFSDAIQAISSSWETNGYGFGATLVRTKHGDYLHLTAGRVK